MKKFKRAMSLFLVLLMILSAFPLNVLADELEEVAAPELAQVSEPSVRDPTTEPPNGEDTVAEVPAEAAPEAAESTAEEAAVPTEDAEAATMPEEEPVGPIDDEPTVEEPLEDSAEETFSEDELTEAEPEISAGSADMSENAEGEAAELQAADSPISYQGYIWTSGGSWSCDYPLEGGRTGHVSGSNKIQLHRLELHGGTKYIGYCIEPGVTSPASGNFKDDQVGVGSDWKSYLSDDQQMAIGLIMLYSETDRKKAGATNIATKASIEWEVATQILIWEVIVGYRADSNPYLCDTPTIINLYSAENIQISGDGWGQWDYISGHNIRAHYNTISNQLATHNEIPSFAGDVSDFAPVRTLKENSAGYYLNLLDTNCVLDRYPFASQGDVTIDITGNNLSVHAPKTADLDGLTFHATATFPDPEDQTYIVWSRNDDQKLVSTFGTLSADPVSAYFKLAKPGGKVTIKKQTNVPGDGAHNVWTFGVYDDAECTNEVAQITTDGAGNGESTTLEPGTYWVKELPSEADLEYWECDTTVHQITLASGENAVLTIENNKYGRVRVIKTTNTGRNVSGWRFAIYRDAACTDLVGTRETAADGTFVSGKLSSGDYWIVELPTEGAGAEYWVCETAPKKVTVVQGQTANVTYYNEQQGKLSVRKTTNTGRDLSGWQFGIYSNAACSNLVETIITDATGYAESGMLPHGTTYWIKELNDGAHIGWTYDTTVTNVTVVGGEVTPAPHVFYNSEYGQIRVRKQTNISGNGTHNRWTFGIYSDAACATQVGTVTTDQTGVGLSGLLEPGNYWVKELPGSVSSYWECDSTTKKITVTGGNTANTPYFTNTAYGNLKVIKTTDTGSNLGGWEIGVYTDAACTAPVAGSPFITDDSGLVTTRLPVGNYWVKEIVDPARSNTWIYDPTIHQVALTLGNTTTVNFANTTRKATVQIVKTTNTGTNLGGWVFDVYLGDTATGTPYCTVTTGADGIVYTQLLPGTYTVKERGRSGWRCESPNPQTVTVAAGEIGSVRFRNTHLGTVTIVKTTSTGRNLGGWEFRITKNGVFVKDVVTDQNGTIAVDLEPGTYRITEHSRDYWHCDGNSTQEITIGPGENAAVTFHNTHYGRAQIVKTTSTGTSLGGWVFDVYEGTSTSGDPYRTVTTGDDGTILTELLPGTYTVVEREQELSICQGENPRTVTVNPGVTTTVSYHNIIKGRLDIVKTIGEGGSLSGWVFDIYTRSGYADDEDPIFSVTTDINGKASLVLDPGDYIVKERERTGWYCVYANPRNITIVPGEIDTEEFHNEPGPTISIVKRIPRDNIHSGGTVESITNRLIGWTFDIYVGRDIFDYDAETPLATYTTTINDVKLDYTLNELVAEIHFAWMPGIYTIHERERSGWTCTDPWDSRHIVWLTAGYDERVEFVNEDNVSVRLYKLIPAQSGLTQKEIKEQFKGWSFDVYEGYFESVGEAGMDSAYVATYTTNDHGILQYDSYGNISGCLIELSGLTNMQPYTIVERPRDGWYCEYNIQNVLPGYSNQTQEVYFENERMGSLTIQKISSNGAAMAGTRWMLEYSINNGATWSQITSRSLDAPLAAGSCIQDVSDGCLVTGADGTAVFTGLKVTGVKYRLTEVRTLGGMSLLGDVAFEGYLPGEFNTKHEYDLTIIAVNDPNTELPSAGVELTNVPLVACGTMILCMLAANWFIQRRRKLKV